ncbi:hypothetical protein G9A89_011320 [Geosiphon pyriformis]|nr:hypothetical protein G9A89_011320 [Geosiphon pyriformis]
MNTSLESKSQKKKNKSLAWHGITWVCDYNDDDDDDDDEELVQWYQNETPSPKRAKIKICYL